MPGTPRSSASPGWRFPSLTLQRRHSIAEKLPYSWQLNHLLETRKSDLEMPDVRMIYGLLGLAVALSLPVGTATAYTISLSSEDPAHLRNAANDKANASFEGITLSPDALPFVLTSTATDNGASAVANYDLSNEAFSITFNHTRLPTHESYGQVFGHIYFSVDQDVQFTATGPVR